jgi:hypothetical protein
MELENQNVGKLVDEENGIARKPKIVIYESTLGEILRRRRQFLIR